MRSTRTVSEPSEEELRRRQGVFLRPARRGLQHIEIFATPDQYEPLLTVMNTATNPRTRAGSTEGGDGTPGEATEMARAAPRTARTDHRGSAQLMPTWTGGPVRNGSSTASSAPAKQP